MSLFTQYGSPWGVLPNTAGRYFYVAPSASYTVEGTVYSASDDNDGLAPNRAVLTVNRAIALATANVGDVIVLLPGSHTVSATVAITKAGLTFTGIPGNNPISKSRHNAGGKRLRTQITSTQTAGIIFTVSAVDTEIAHIAFLPPAAGGRGISLAPLSGAANRTYIHDCTFSLIATASTTTYGITVPAGVTADLLEDVMVSSCYFVSGTGASSGANGSAVNALGTVHGLTIENSTFELKGTAAWAAAILTSNAGSLGVVVRDCDFITPTSVTTVMTVAINATGQTVDGSTVVLRSYFPVGTDGIASTATADAFASESYTAGTTGGVLLSNA